MNTFYLFLPNIRKLILVFIFLFFGNGVFAQDSIVLIPEIETLLDETAKAAGTDAEQAEIYAKQALALSVKEKNDRYIAVSYRIVGLCTYLKRELDSTEYFYTKSLEIYKKNNWNTRNLAHLYNSFALLKNAVNEYEEAISFYNKSLEINIQNADTSGIVGNYVNMGILYSRLNDNKKAIELYQKTLDYNYDNYKVSVLTNMGVSYSKLDQKDKAVKAYEEALALSENSDNFKNTANILNNISNIYIEQGRLKKAEILLEKSLNISTQYNYYNKIIHSYMLRGNIRQQEKKYTQALNNYFKALDLEKKHSDSEIRYKIYEEISKVYQAQKKHKKALEFYKKYTILKDSVVNKESFVKISELEAKYKSEKQLNKIHNLETENKTVKLKNAENNFILTVIISLITVIILTAFIFFLRYRNKQQKLKHNIEKQRFELEQRMLRSQMNPHFIFNALNSIQSFIASNNNMNAEIFLSKFALLIRNILENSSTEFVDFDKESETLQLYVELERLRFNNSFDFEIRNNLEDNLLKIPPMLIQPIVENAILHGLRNKKNDGMLIVEFEELNDNYISCAVSDNGIGRKAAESIKQKKKRGHNSMASQLTADRLNYFSPENKAQNGIRIIDLYDNENKAAGTKVILNIPFRTN